MISVQSCRAEGPSWPVPIWSGPSVCSTQTQCTVVITVMVEQRSWWCGYKYKPGLIPLVHKQRLELLWEPSTKVCGPPRAAELHRHSSTSGSSGQLLVSHQMRMVGQPMRGLNSTTEGWRNGWHWEKRWQRYEDWGMLVRRGHRALLKIGREILLLFIE